MRIAIAGLALGLALAAAEGARAATPPRPGAGAIDQGASAEAHFELGEMYHRQVFDSLDQAIKEYEAAIKLQPELAQAHYNLGLSYHAKAKLGSDDPRLYRKALEEYRLYLRASPNSELAPKARQNIQAVEAKLRELEGGAPAKRGRAGSTKTPAKAR